MGDLRASWLDDRSKGFEDLSRIIEKTWRSDALRP